MAKEVAAKGKKELVVKDELVNKAYDFIFDTMSKYYEDAIMKVGRYLIDHFYGGKVEDARKKGECEEQGSLNKLIEKFADDPNRNNSQTSPKKSWIYNSVNLVAQGEDIKNEMGEELFQTYGNLKLSHKISLLTVDIEKYKKEKIQLINEIDKKALTVKGLEDRKKELLPKRTWSETALTIIRNPEKAINEENKKIISLEALQVVKKDVLKKYKTRSEEKQKELNGKLADYKEIVKEHEEYIKKYNQIIQNIEDAIKDNKAKPKKGKKKAK